MVLLGHLGIVPSRFAAGFSGNAGILSGIWGTASAMVVFVAGASAKFISDRTKGRLAGIVGLIYAADAMLQVPRLLMPYSSALDSYSMPRTGIFTMNQVQTTSCCRTTANIVPRPRAL